MTVDDGSAASENVDSDLGAPAPSVAATLANPPADFIPAATDAAVGVTGATAAQVQQAVDESGLSVNGAGIKVGVLSDSFNDLGGAAADEADGALPPAADVQVLSDLSSGGTDEGRAMMQIVHDIAPGASLAFYTAFGSEQSFADGILALAAAGCKVICDDVSYFDEPFFQNGVVAQAIQTVEAEGVTYVTAAGNDASNAYQAAWTPISGTFDGKALSDTESFGGSLTQTITVTATSTNTVPLLLEWNQAYGDATADLEILIFRNGSLVGTATNRTSGESTNPWAEFTFTASGTYQIAIENLSGPNPGLIKEITEGDGLPVTISGANSGTVYGHAMTPGAITAGAVSAADSPAFGVSPTSESFSSSGAGTELLFANNGTALSSPDVLSPVAVSGVDDINTTVSDLSDFYGTSAASASLAGVAAVILAANPGLTPAEVEQIMEQTAIPMANSAVSGAGLVQVDAAVAAAVNYGTPVAVAPAVLSISAGSNSSTSTVTAGDIVTITVDLNENVTVTGTPTLQLNDDEVATYSAGSGTDALIFSNTVKAGDITPNLTVTSLNLPAGASITNGNGAALTTITGDLELNIEAPIGQIPTVTATAPAPSDFNGDGYSDILWRNSNGSLAAWLMNGSTISSGLPLSAQGNAVSPDSSWSVAGIGDFNDDGTSDILWRQSTTGAVVDWTMNGSTISSSQNLTFQGNVISPNASWSVAGIGNFGSSGSADILWRQSGTGSLVDWSMNGATILSSENLTFQGSVVSPDSTWSVAGIGNFNGGSYSDILWQQSTTGALAEWQMNGSQIESSQSITYQGSAISPASSWSVAGIGDFNGAGDADILWRQNSTDTLAMWLLNGSVVASSLAPTYQGIAITPNSSWNVVEIGDFNGNGKSDILWQQSTTGALAEWLMSGSQILSSQTVTSLGAAIALGSSWQVQGNPADSV